MRMIERWNFKCSLCSRKCEMSVQGMERMPPPFPSKCIYDGTPAIYSELNPTPASAEKGEG